MCLFAAGGGGGICEIIETPISSFLYSIGFGTDGDLPEEDLFSMCVWFALALTQVVYWQSDICSWSFSFIFMVMEVCLYA